MVRAFICGCAGLELTPEERSFLSATRPWGLILFKRNVDSPRQLWRLVSDFRTIVGRADAPVLVDQEGGRVQRLGPPHWQAYPSASAYGALAARDLAGATEAAELGGRLISDDLARAGITIDCAPVLDVPAPGSSSIVGDRAFGTEPEIVVRLGRAFAEGLLAGGVLPVIKHIPGHGRAEVDSHFELPVVTADRESLQSDCEPFRRLADLPMAMSAHVIYTAYDAERPGTISPIVVDSIVRGSIGFDGLLLTDDLSMQALRGTLGERAEAALGAGCDIALHCNGKLDEAAEVAGVAPVLAGKAERRALDALARLNAPGAFDVEAGRARLSTLLGARALTSA